MQRTASDSSPEQLLASAARGDEEAWQHLVRMYTPRVFGLLARQCGDRELAEEITQATFVKLVVALQQYAEKGRFEPWLFRIAMNQLRDEMRRRKRQASHLSLAAEEDAGGDPMEMQTDRRRAAGTDGDLPWEHASRAEQIEVLRDAIARLGDADREILTLRHTEGMSFPDIAETLQQPLGTVLARAHRAVGKLQAMMKVEKAPKRRRKASGDA